MNYAMLTHMLTEFVNNLYTLLTKSPKIPCEGAHFNYYLEVIKNQRNYLRITLNKIII